MEQFDTVDQSGQRMGRSSIYSQPINIEVINKFNIQLFFRL